MPLRLALTLAIAAGGMVLAPPLQAATVTVVHGVPGFRADVYVNGKKALTGFQAGAMTTPIHLPAGRYHLAIRPAGAAPSSAPALAASVTLGARENASVVAHLDAQGKPMISLYRNDVSSVAVGRSRFTFRQVAASPPVDVLVDGRPVFRDVGNSAERTTTVPAHTYTVSVVRAGTHHRLWGPAPVSVRGRDHLHRLRGRVVHPRLAGPARAEDPRPRTAARAHPGGRQRARGDERGRGMVGHPRRRPGVARPSRRAADHMEDTRESHRRQLSAGRVPGVAGSAPPAGY
jgi:hypothetical protein